jgi:PIN domain nuclease of toxin-antitoxin system
MRILLDSHALAWFLLGDKRLPPRLRTEIENIEADVFVSAVCAWEIGSKIAKGQWPEAINVPAMIDDLVARLVFLPLPITIQHARVASFLRARHRDPFDRMLAAQAQVESLPLVTVDPFFREFEIQVIW